MRLLIRSNHVEQGCEDVANPARRGVGGRALLPASGLRSDDSSEIRQQLLASQLREGSEGGSDDG